MRTDLKDIGVEESEWYEEAWRSRASWRELCRLGMENYREAEVVRKASIARDVVCEVCSRTFRRESDLKRHKCLAERLKPISKQRGSVQCLQCRKWFLSKGGLAVHTCRPGG